MKTCAIRLFPIALGVLYGLPASLSANETNESNLTLLDTVNPAIRDLAVAVGAVVSEVDQVSRSEADTVYDHLNSRNKLGVIFSEGLAKSVISPTFGYNQYFFNLLFPSEGRGSWTVADFMGSSNGPFFCMNGDRYQVLPGKDVLPWDEKAVRNNRLGWVGANASYLSFVALLNTPSSNKVQLYKRFEFPASLHYTDQSVLGYEQDRTTISSTARKLVIVLHGWNTVPDSDPYESGNWPALLRNLSEQITSKAAYAPNWDLYAYNWGRDSYTGNLDGNDGDERMGYKLINLNESSAHVNGGVGLGQENGTQAAEIGYQHGLVLGKLIRDHCTANGIPLEKVHFIAHSAGTWVARSASLYLNATKGSSNLQQQITLLDPYNPHAGFLDWTQELKYYGGEDSTLDTTKINDWASTVQPVRCENIFSDDYRIAGTNEKNYWEGISHQNWQRFENRQVGSSDWGIEGDEYSWDAHSGPIRFYSFSVNPVFRELTTLGNVQSLPKLWAMATKRHIAMVGWEQSMFMAEYIAAPKSCQLAAVASSGYSVLMSVQPRHPRGPGSPAPQGGSAWKQILVDVDESGWVRAMLVPVGGGAAVLAGPARVEPEGTFSINLTDGTVLAGIFDASANPVAITLTVDGEPFGQRAAKAQGAIARTGIDANVNAAGNGVVSIVLADGTTGMSVARDAANTGWEASGVGVVDGTGAFSISGENGLQITGQLKQEGGLDSLATAVAPPQVPEIYVQNGAGASLTSGASSADCGNVQFGFTSRTYDITIMNTGTVPLTELGISVDGLNSADFAVSDLGTTSLDPDTSKTFSVTFSPGAVGERTAKLHIASNDANENPFDVELTGYCFSATALASGAGGTAGVLSAGGEEFYRVPVSGPGILIAWTEGSTDTYGAIFNSGGVALDEDNDSDRQANFRTSAAVVAGDYFIRVSGFGASIAGPYTIHTRFIPDSEPILISFLEKAGDDVNLGFNSVAGESYSIFGSDDMIEWTEITKTTGNGAEMLVALPWHGVFPRKFFRVSTIQP
jgi:hypothetical protein